MKCNLLQEAAYNAKHILCTLLPNSGRYHIQAPTKNLSRKWVQGWPPNSGSAERSLHILLDISTRWECDVLLRRNRRYSLEQDEQVMSCTSSKSSAFTVYFHVWKVQAHRNYWLDHDYRGKVAHRTCTLQRFFLYSVEFGSIGESLTL